MVMCPILSIETKCISQYNKYIIIFKGDLAVKYEVASYNTKKTLAESLKKIMKTKSFSKITISEIITDSGVNRKTFYYHFEDIYALLKWIFENEAIEIVKHFNLAVDYEEAILFVMDYIEKNDYIINCAYDAIGRDEMKRFLYNDFIEIVSSLISYAEDTYSKKLAPDYKRFLCDFYTEALAGMLIDWIKNKDHLKREQVVSYISDTLKYSMDGIFQSTT